MNAERLDRTRSALDLVHEGRVARARLAHEAALRTLNTARKTREGEREYAARAHRDRLAAEVELEHVDDAGRCRGEDLLLLITRVEGFKREEEAVARRLNVAVNVCRRAESEVQLAFEILHRAELARKHVYDTLGTRIRAHRSQRESRSDERVTDDLVARRGALR